MLINRNTTARSINAPTATVVRDGVDFLSALGPHTTITTTAGRLTATIPPMAAQILIAKSGQSIAPPPAPTQVQATRQSNGLVRINWDAVDDVTACALSVIVEDGPWPRLEL